MLIDMEITTGRSSRQHTGTEGNDGGQRRVLQRLVHSGRTKAQRKRIAGMPGAIWRPVCSVHGSAGLRAEVDLRSDEGVATAASEVVAEKSAEKTWARLRCTVLRVRRGRTGRSVKGPKDCREDSHLSAKCANA